MHGRLKVKTTEQQQAEKKAERAAKVKAYNAAMKQVFEARKKFKAITPETDLPREDVALILATLNNLSRGLLLSNPDITLLWNIRKEILEFTKSLVDPTCADLSLKKELELSQQCLMTNPKSYGSWYHRLWCLRRSICPNWNREVELCSRYLSQDERNFHCWDYRRDVIDELKANPEANTEVTDQTELDFTMEAINANFSNYSAWHVRSKLLPFVCPADEASNGVGISSEKHLEELDLIKNAAFTDPEDSSAWFYHTWLLGKQGLSQRNYAQLVALIRERECVQAIFNLPVRRSEVKFEVKSTENNIPKAIEGSDTLVSQMWSLPNNFGGQDVKVSYQEQSLTLDETVNEVFAPEPEAAEVDQSFVAGLREDLSNCEELLELEPDSKWTRLSTILIMQALPDSERGNATDHEAKVLEHLDQLVKVDPARKNFYNDLRSRVELEGHLSKQGHGGYLVRGDLDLSGLELTSLPCAPRLALCKSINLKDNKFSSLSSQTFSYLRKCETLAIDGGLVDETSAKACMPSLKNLNI